MMLAAAGCSSKQGGDSESPLPPSEQPGKTFASSQALAPPASPATQVGKGNPGSPQEDNPISYARNPERFVKMPPYEPPFNITNPRTAQEHFNVAVNDDHLNRLEEAVREYQKALEMQPDWPVAHYRLALVYQKQGQTDDAIAEWKQATRYDPEFYSAYDMLAGAYERQGRINEAIDAYSALLKYPPAQMPVHYQLGLWYAQIGDRRQAQSHLESYRALALKTREEPKSDRFRKALHQLQALKPGLTSQ
jgi:tetratricopeptide (TPR) repeat protein